jgi:RimJ/RimL family protein N-acetyltransferase
MSRLLVAPTAALYDAFRAAREDWGPGVHEDGFGLLPTDVVGSHAGFEAWVLRLRGTPDVTYRWIMDGPELLGAVAARHRLADSALVVGQIGYGVRPSARGCGVATWALGEMLATVTALGPDPVLVVCVEGNAASARVIERCGGVLNGVQASPHGPARRYWVWPGARADLRATAPG